MTINGFTIASGLVIGLPVGLLAMGLVLVYRASRVVNFAHGQLGVVGAVLLSKLVIDDGLPYGVALPLGVAFGALVGAGLELVLRRLSGRPRLMATVATIGLAQALFLLTLLPVIRPDATFVDFPLPWHWSFSFPGYRLLPSEALVLFVGPLAALAAIAWFRFTRVGLHLRAASDNADSARLAGVPVRRVTTLAWMAAGMLSTVAALLAAPGEGNGYVEALGPAQLLVALSAALFAGMSSLPGALLAGVLLGEIQQNVGFNVSSPVTQEVVGFVLLLVALLVRARSLAKGAQEQTSWSGLSIRPRPTTDVLRRRIGRSGVVASLAFAAVLPLLVGQGRDYLIGRVFVFALIALSMTLLTGWAGQVSLGHFAVVAIGAVVTVRLAGHVPLPLLFLYAGAIGAAVAVVVGLPALRIPGLYLAVTTLGFALFMQTAVLVTPCEKLPLIGVRACTGLPSSDTNLLRRPKLFGLALDSDRAVCYLALGVLGLTLLAMLAWRDRGLARLLVSVRGNETAAAAMGVRVLKAKLSAFAVSGFLAGVAGVIYALVQHRFGAAQFTPSDSLLIVAMVVVGGLGSVSGAVLGAVYLVGLPAVFGSTPTVQTVTSSLGLLFFLLFLPGGLVSVTTRFADLLTAAIHRLRPGRGRWPAQPGFVEARADDLVGAGS